MEKTFVSIIWGVIACSSILSAQDSVSSVATRYPDMEPISFKQLPTTIDDVRNYYAESPDGSQFLFVSNPSSLNNRVVAFDANDGRMLWSHEGNYSGGIRYTDAGILLYSITNQQFLDQNTGENLWLKKPSFWKGYKVPVYTKANILMTSADAAGAPFLGIDLNTGKQVWKKTIKRKYGISYIYDIDDTHSFIVADRLYKIDWTTGETEDIKINIGDVSGKRVWAQIGLGVGLGVYPGAMRTWQGNT